jgi:hypothetical protein
MKKQICDVCKKEFDRTFKPYTIEASYNMNVDSKSILPFDIEVKILRMKFCTTGLDFCRDCTLAAIQYAVASMQ